MRMILLCCFNRLTGNFYPVNCVNDASDEDIIDSHIRGVKAKAIKNPEELKLFKVGEFDDKTGELTKYDDPVLLVDLSKYADPEKVKEVNNEIARYISINAQSN